MTHYSNKPDHVRVDFFKESGKWYTTEQMEWIGPWKMEGAPLIWAQFAESIRKLCTRPGGDPKSYYYSDMIAVCLEPYHENAFPLMMKVADIFAGKYD